MFGKIDSFHGLYSDTISGTIFLIFPAVRDKIIIHTWFILYREVRRIQSIEFWNRPAAMAASEKRDIFRTANWIGGALIISQLAAFFAASGYAMLLYFLGHLTQSGKSTHFMDDEMSYILFSILMFVPFFVLCVRCSHRRLSEVVRFDKHPPKLGAALVLVCLGFFLAGNLLSNFVYYILNSLGHPPYQPVAFQPDTPFGLAAALLSSACIPALAEEFAFRGVVLGLLRPYGKRMAIIVSAILFALMHGNLVQIPFAFVGGLALGYATVRSGSLWPSIIAHFINNAMSYLLNYLVRDLPQDSGDLIYFLYTLLLLVLGVVGFILVRRYNRRTSYRLNDGDGTFHAAALSERAAMLAGSPTLIVFALYCIYSASQFIL